MQGRAGRAGMRDFSAFVAARYKCCCVRSVRALKGQRCLDRAQRARGLVDYLAIHTAESKTKAFQDGQLTIWHPVA